MTFKTTSSSSAHDPNLASDTRPIRLTYIAAEVLVEGHAAFTHAMEIIAGLRRRRVAVRVVSPERDRTTRSLPEKLWDYAMLYLRLATRGRGVDCYYVRLHPALFPIVYFLRRAKAPVVIEVNGPPSDALHAHPIIQSARRIYVFAFKQALRCATAIVSVTPTLSAWIELHADGVPVQTIPNGANIEMFRPDMAKPADVPDVYALFFGSFAPWQGIATILEAESDPAWPADVHLLFIGDGSLRHAVEEAAATRPRVSYIGVRPYDQVAPYVANALCGLSVKDDSVEHISPLKAYETLSCGTPLIASDHATQVEIVSREDPCGIIVGRADARSTAEAVARLRHEPTESARMGRAARRQALAELSWDSRSQEVFELISAVTLSPEHRP